jgi:hypothetical protein
MSRERRRRRPVLGDVADVAHVQIGRDVGVDLKQRRALLVGAVGVEAERRGDPARIPAVERVHRRALIRRRADRDRLDPDDVVGQRVGARGSVRGDRRGLQEPRGLRVQDPAAIHQPAEDDVVGGVDLRADLDDQIGVGGARHVTP